MSKTVVFASMMMIVAAMCGCGGSSAPASPQQHSVAGVWKITCTQEGADCAEFSITTDDSGALLDAEVPGFSGVIPGGASIDTDNQGNQVLRINISDAYSFEGNLQQTGKAATGTLRIADIENGEELVTASAVLTQ
jgi:hypothetical protein